MFQSADVIFFKCKASVYAGIQLDFFDRPNEGYITQLGFHWQVLDCMHTASAKSDFRL